MATPIFAALSIDDLAARFLPMLVDATIKGSVLLALAGVMLLTMRRASAAARQLVLLVALASLLVMPAVSAALPGWQILPGWAKVEMPSPREPEPVCNDSGRRGSEAGRRSRSRRCS